MDAAIIWGVVFFVTYFLLDYLSNKYLRNDLLSSFPLIVYFIFIYANIDERVAPFYLFMAILVLTFSGLKFGMSKIQAQNSTSMMVPTLDGRGKSIKGAGFYIFQVVLGIVFFFGMRLVLSGVSSDKLQVFMGVPLLSIAALKANLSYVSVMALAVIENKFMVIIKEFFDLLKKTLAQALQGVAVAMVAWIPLLNTFLVPFMTFIGAGFVMLGPIIVSAFIFALFHLAAYNLVLGSIIFAGSVMAIWLIAYQVTGNDIIMNVAHMLWNAVINFYRLINGG